MKRTLKLALLTGLLAQTLGGNIASANISDISGHWAERNIKNAVSLGYVDGYPDGTFKPDISITRAEFLKMAVTALESGSKIEDTSSLPDGGKSVTASMVGFVIDEGPKWYVPFVKEAVSLGLITSDEFAEAELNEAITRLELARVAVRSTGEKNDDPLKWMYIATSKGIINGMDDQGTLGEDQATTRAQAITVIERMLKLKAGEKLKSDRYATSAAEIAWHKSNIYTMAPEYFGYGKALGRDIDWNQMRYDGENGYSEIEKVIIVDMGDPTDPSRKLIPDDMKWIMSVGNSRTATEDVPPNAYAVLSFNHFYVKTDNKIDVFRFSQILTSNFGRTNGNIDQSGNLIQTTRYGRAYEENGNTIKWGSISIPAGETDMQLVTGMLVPKMAGTQGEGFALYRMVAQELGEGGNDVVVYSSKIDHSLGGNK